MKFIVEVRPPLPEDLAGVAEKLAEAFNISRAKANGLLRRAPGPVTKPVSEREASVVAGIFESAGLSVTTLPEPDVLRATGVAEVQGDPWQSTPADVADAGIGVERARTEHEESAVGVDVTAPLNEGAAGFEDEHADAGPGDEAGGLEVLADEDSGAVADSRGAENVHPGGRDEFDRDSGTDALSGRGSSDGDLGRRDGVMADRPGDGYARFGEAAAASTVVEPLRDDGLEDVALEDDALGQGALPHRVPSFDAGLDDAGLDRVDLDDPRLGDDLAKEHRDRDGDADIAQDDAFGVSPVAVIAGGAAAASRSAGAATEGERVPTGHDALDGEPPADPSSTAAGYRSGVRDLQRHGGTTAAELGVHARNAQQREATASSMRRRIVAVGIWPALLTLLVVMVGAALTLLPVLRHQQAAAAHRTASSLASSVEGVSAGLPLGAPIVNAVLSDIAARSQAGLVGQGVDYLVITDDQGLPLAGWYGSAASLANLPPDVGRAVATAATGVAVADAEVTPRETFLQSLAASWRDVRAMLGLGTFQGQVGSAAIRDGGNLMGTVVVGMNPSPLWSEAGNALLITLLLGLIPVLIGIFAAMALARRVTGGLRYLLDAADRISRGDLEHAVQLSSKDELGQLARAIERMRVSLQEGLERLRRRR